MTALIEWCGFLGAWLLFAGPVYQAALELAEEDFERSTLATAINTVPPAPHTSNWWWLIPPVGYYLTQRRHRSFREAVLVAIGPQRVESWVSYSAKSSGWLLVGLGGLLLAARETWGLREYYELPTWSFWAIVGGMAVICAGYTVTNQRRSEDIRRSFGTKTTGATDATGTADATGATGGGDRQPSRTATDA